MLCHAVKRGTSTGVIFHGGRRCLCWIAPRQGQQLRGWRYTGRRSMPGRYPSDPPTHQERARRAGKLCGGSRPCPPCGAQERPRACLVHHPGSTWGTAAVPMLGGSMPRTAAPRTATHRAQIRSKAGTLPAHSGHPADTETQIPTASPDRPAQEGRELGGGLCFVPCSCPPCGAHGRHHEAQGALSHHPGPGGSLPLGAVAVPLLDGFTSRVVAPRMAAHLAQIHAVAVPFLPSAPPGQPRMAGELF